MPPPETFVYIKTHHSTIPNYVCVDKIPAKPPPTATDQHRAYASKNDKCAVLLAYATSPHLPPH